MNLLSEILSAILAGPAAPDKTESLPATSNGTGENTAPCLELLAEEKRCRGDCGKLGVVGGSLGDMKISSL